MINEELKQERINHYRSYLKKFYSNNDKYNNIDKKQYKEYKKLKNRLYSGSRWKRVKKAIYEERGWKCQCCNKSYIDTLLIVHHIKEITPDNMMVNNRVNESLMYNKDNLLLVCIDCHNEIHKPMGSIKLASNLDLNNRNINMF